MQFLSFDSDGRSIALMSAHPLTGFRFVDSKLFTWIGVIVSFNGQSRHWCFKRNPSSCKSCLIIIEGAYIIIIMPVDVPIYYTGCRVGNVIL